MGFRCQNCETPLELDDSLKPLTRAQVKVLFPDGHSDKRTPPGASSYIPKDRLELFNESMKNSKPYIEKNHLEFDPHSPPGPAQSFVYVSDQNDEIQDEHSNDTSVTFDTQLPDFSKISTLDQVFKILSDNSDVTHPLSADCADLLIENYKLKFDQSQREKDYYLSFLKKLRDRGAAADETPEQLDVKLAEASSNLSKLQLDEEEKLKKLEELEESNQQLEQQLSDLNAQLAELRSSELKEVFELKNKLQCGLQDKQAKLDQAKAAYHKQLNTLDHLRQFNVYTRLFQISFDDCGRINGFRLGYRVPWAECNVALGHIVSLLKFLKSSLDISLPEYTLVPLGSRSYVVKHGTHSVDASGRSKTNSILPLHSSNEFTLGKLFNFNKLDVSMIALLDIVGHFEQKLVTLDDGLVLPYEISVPRGTIGGKSIRVTSNSQWTESCRCLLVNLNWILVYVSTQSERQFT